MHEITNRDNRETSIKIISVKLRKSTRKIVLIAEVAKRSIEVVLQMAESAIDRGKSIVKGINNVEDKEID